MGISTEQAYLYLLKGKKATPVIVAVIDVGVDTLQEDLRTVLWRNPKEKINGKDDDHNGYIDDIFGWSFLGSAKGNVLFDSNELVREVRRRQHFFAAKDTSRLDPADTAAYRLFKIQKADLAEQLASARTNRLQLERLKKTTVEIIRAIGKPNPILDDFLAYDSKDMEEERALKAIVTDFQQKKDSDMAAFLRRLDESIAHYRENADYWLNINFDSRNIVGDNYNDSREKFYGCGDVTGPEAVHGTHVAGIIGADRTNHLGITGVADHVLLMSIRAVLMGDQRDKDVANAIRYAVDNGARIINMSFGKTYSPERTGVNDAVRYAMEKDVLIIHAAGNDNKNLDKENLFPNRVYADHTGSAKAWIEVGASSFKNDENLKAPFSNYGQTTVDVFAPGVKINSSAPGNKYEKIDGTSMAAPVVAGLAALIREYHPKLTALQVKEIIMKSVFKVDHPVILDIKGKQSSVPFSSLCITGGIVNAYNALKLAEHYE